MRFNLNRVPVKVSAFASLLLTGILTLAVAACGGNDPTATPAPTATQSPAAAAPAQQPAQSAPAMNLAQLSGDINIDGSSTVFP